MREDVETFSLPSGAGVTLRRDGAAREYVLEVREPRTGMMAQLRVPDFEVEAGGLAAVVEHFMSKIDELLIQGGARLVDHAWDLDPPQPIIGRLRCGTCVACGMSWYDGPESRGPCALVSEEGEVVRWMRPRGYTSPGVAHLWAGWRNDPDPEPRPTIEVNIHNNLRGFGAAGGMIGRAIGQFIDKKCLWPEWAAPPPVIHEAETYGGETAEGGLAKLERAMESLGLQPINERVDDQAYRDRLRAAYAPRPSPGGADRKDGAAPPADPDRKGQK